ncbi:MAG: PQQ-binding-like beta-propeller repeat protein, partial [Candidatus Nitrosocaldus sp.]|nr:PQQ-binding-like beta-propeller repeat protein [Candidatus Nitrosocaldus sp.]MDW8000904.1 PQQ-binding-like beta-propeller repeat protein [Candidatus Nitrosocaldus sp.]
MDEQCWPSFKRDERRRSAVGQSIARRPSLHWVLRLEPMVASCICSNMLYASTLAGSVYAVELSGRMRWVHRCSMPIVSTPVFVGDDRSRGMIVAATFSRWLEDEHGERNIIFALDAENGNLLWELHIDGDVFSSPCYADGLVVLGALDGHVYAVD